MENIEITEDKLRYYNERLIEMMRGFSGLNYISIIDLFKEKDRKNPSVAIQDIKKIGYFTENKIKKLGEMNREELIKIYGSTNIYNPLLRKKNGIMCKSGKFFRYLFPDFNDSTIQKMVAKWYSIIEINENSSFKISIEDDIHKYYHQDKYLNESGSLGGSCMKYSSCQEYLDFYDNYNVKVVVLKNSDDIIKGRALLWKDVYFHEIDKTLDFMDRIYINNDNDIEIFKDFAIKNNIVYKEYQSYDYKKEFVYIDEFYCSIEIEPINKNIQYNFFPYLDTLTFMNDNKYLSNNRDLDFYIELDDTEGGNSEENGDIICRECDNRFDSEYDGLYIENYGYVCESCSNNYNFCEDCETHHYQDNVTYLEKYDKWICDDCLSDDYFMCKECNEYFYLGDSYEHDYNHYCNDCYHELFMECEHCNGVVSNDEIIENDDNEYLCNVCFNLWENKHKCQECGEIFDILNNNGNCEDCQDEIDNIELIETKKEIEKEI